MAKAPVKKAPTVAAKKATFGGLNNSYEPKIPVTRQPPRDTNVGTGIVNARLRVQNPVPDNSSSLHQTGTLPRPNIQGPNKGSALTPLGKRLARKKPAVEDPPLPPADGSVGGATTPTTPVSPPPTAPVPKEWSAIVNHYFPNGGTGYKAGGLVRGCGAATKGRGRGKMV